MFKYLSKNLAELLIFSNNFSTYVFLNDEISPRMVYIGNEFTEIWFSIEHLTGHSDEINGWFLGIKGLLA